MDFSKLEKIIKGEPSFRLKQIKKSVFKDFIQDWGLATNLSLELRERLKKDVPLTIEADVFGEKDVIKALITLKDELKVESVLMKHKDGRNTVCVSSQIGCPLACSFCLTGKMGFKRNLTSDEIVEQVLFFCRYLKKRIDNVVFMGMGEPFLNYDNVLSAIRIMNDKDGMNIGTRRISISTVGIIEGIKKLSGEGIDVNLALSLHAPEDSLRTKLMMVNKKYPLKEVLKAVDEYIKKTRRRVMIEYIMIKDINDSDKDALLLAELVKKPLLFLNLISYNRTGVFEPSLRIKRFKQILEKQNIAVTQRHKFGEDINAACGQLAGKK